MREFVVPIIVHDGELPVPNISPGAIGLTSGPQKMWR